MLLLRPLRRRPVALLWAGLALSAVGDQVYNVALTWIAVTAFGPAAGFLAALGAATVLVTALLGGRLADAARPHRAMIAADGARAAVLALVVAASVAQGQPSAAALVVGVVVLGAGQAVFRPAMQAVMPALVADAAMLPAANALFDSTDRIARLLGPGFVGLLAALLPAMGFLALDALTFLASASALLLIGRSGAALPGQAGTTAGVLAAATAGFRTVRAHPVLRYVLSITGLLNGAWYATFFLALPLMIERHGLGLSAYGLILSAYGCTNLAATLVIGNRPLTHRPAVQIFSGNLVLGGGILVLAVVEASGAASTPLYALAAALSAVGGPMQDIPVAVLRQTELPRAQIPAAIRAFLVANQGGLLLAMLVAPPLLAGVHPAWFIAGCGAAIVAVGLGGLREAHQRAHSPLGTERAGLGQD